MPSDRYLVTLSGRSGLYAQRAVPKNLHARLGTKLWRKKAGNTLSEARRFLPGFLAWTEELMNAARREPKQLTLEEDLLLARGRTVDEIIEYWPQVDWDDVEEVSKLPPVQLITAEEIIDKAKRLKSPAAGTVREWSNCFHLFTDFTNLQFPLSATKDHATRFRDHLLKEKKSTTVKKIVRFLRAHWQLCIDEQLTTVNIWDGVVKHLKDDERIDKVLASVQTDTNTEALSDKQKMLYFLVRYTGMRIQEALGLTATELSTKERLITVRDNEFRGVGGGIKNIHSRRQIPISSKLLEWLSDLPSEGLLFPEYLSKSGKLNTPSFFRNRLGIGPHALRHHAATCLREAGFNERVIGDLLGHAPSMNGQTSKYGTTTLQTLREAVEKIY